jgi:dTDP-4-dehydrorhamnose 3,5-epimerase
MQFIPLEMPEVIHIKPKVFEDDRGFFLERYHKERFESGGIQAVFVQDNQSASRQGVLRGLHYQIRQAQGKLVQVIVGEVYDVAVDLRRSSPAFGRCVDLILSSKKKNQLWIPPGFAHGFYVLSDWAEILYKTTDYYAPQWERTLLWNDPTLGIHWPLLDGRPPLLSPKDAEGRRLTEAETYD